MEVSSSTNTPPRGKRELSQCDKCSKRFPLSSIKNHVEHCNELSLDHLSSRQSPDKKKQSSSTPPLSTTPTKSPAKSPTSSPKVNGVEKKSTPAKSPTKKQKIEKKLDNEDDAEITSTIINTTSTTTTSTTTLPSSPSTSTPSKKKKERSGRMMTSTVVSMNRPGMMANSKRSTKTTPTKSTTSTKNMNGDSEDEDHMTDDSDNENTNKPSVSSPNRMGSKDNSPSSSCTSSTSSTPRKKKYALKKTRKAIVEEIGQKEWPEDTVRSWKIREAPVFYPTLEEFRYPLKYIEKIRMIGEQYGICKIVPPQPRVDDLVANLDPKNFKFKTKIQNIHQLKRRWSGPSEVFVSHLCQFLAERGTPLEHFPKYDGRDLDLYKLFVEVNRRGGLHEVTKTNSWHDILLALKTTDACQRPINSLKHHYNDYLLAYEEERRRLYTNLLKRGSGNGSTPKKIKSFVDMIIDECTRQEDYSDDEEDDEEDDDEYEDDEEENNVDRERQQNGGIVKESKGSAEDFGFYEGNIYTLEDFENLAIHFSKKWFPEGENTPEAVENAFWRIVEYGDENVQVHYGSDLDVRTHKSGFERGTMVDDAERGGKCSDGRHWNLNSLPKMDGSIFSHLEEEIAGVTNPMMYIGMLFSSFCWHNEDNYLYSINYMHKGTYKTWYGVPSDASERFENIMRQTLPKLFEKTPNLLYLLITMVSPELLNKHGLPVYTTLQGPGEYVITFPQAYHAGFSHGFTVAEAVNFAPADWIPYGGKSVERYKQVKRPSVFSLEQFLLDIAQSTTPPPSKELLNWLIPELRRIRDLEANQRKQLQNKGYQLEDMTLNEKEQLDQDNIQQCFICKFDCYLSYIYCDNCNNNNNNNVNNSKKDDEEEDEEMEEDDEESSKVYCMLHACKCGPTKSKIKINKSIPEIDQIIQSLNNLKQFYQQQQQQQQQKSSNKNQQHDSKPVYKIPFPSSVQIAQPPNLNPIFSKKRKSTGNNTNSNNQNNNINHDTQSNNDINNINSTP